MSVHTRKLKIIEFTIDESEFACQIASWTLDPGLEDGDVQFTFCPDGSFIEETDPQPTLDVTFYSDWRSDGVSAFLWEHQGEVADFVLDHHPDIPEEHVRWTGQLIVKPGPVGGDAREYEQTEVTFQIIPTSLQFERVTS